MLTCSVPLMYELILTYYFISFLLYNLLKIPANRTESSCLFSEPNMCCTNSSRTESRQINQTEQKLKMKNIKNKFKSFTKKIRHGSVF